MATYVTHCKKCKRCVNKDELDANPEMPCPPEKSGELKGWSAGEKALEMNPYTKKFDGRTFYPNVGKYFDSHKDYERHLKQTGREIINDGSPAWKKEDEGYMGGLRTNEKRRRKTLYFT